ncbi:MAG: hypothetical protein ACQEWV_01645 [Bacillota bacterium]
MKRSILIAFIIPIIILSSCENVLFSHDETDEDITQDKQLLFFSDVDNIDREAVYYDALLDIRKEFPEEFENMKVISEHSDNGKYNVDIYPSLLVIKKEEIVVQIEGAVLSKEEIMRPVADALSH